MSWHPFPLLTDQKTRESASVMDGLVNLSSATQQTPRLTAVPPSFSVSRSAAPGLPALGARGYPNPLRLYSDLASSSSSASSSQLPLAALLLQHSLATNSVSNASSQSTPPPPMRPSLSSSMPSPWMNYYEHAPQQTVQSQDMASFLAAAAAASASSNMPQMRHTQLFAHHSLHQMPLHQLSFATDPATLLARQQLLQFPQLQMRSSPDFTDSHVLAFSMPAGPASSMPEQPVKPNLTVEYLMQQQQKPKTLTPTPREKNQSKKKKKKQSLKFECPLPGCGRDFKSKFALNYHLQAHTGVKPFECPYADCRARFTAKSSLNCHRRKVHNEAMLDAGTDV